MDLPPSAGVVGIGIDVVDVERFREALGRTPTMRTRLFTDDELRGLAAKADPVPSLAARFAAREAVMKALGVGLGAFGFHDAWVVVDDAGAPALVIRGAAQRLADERGIDRFHLSLSHDGGVAVAMVVAAARRV